MKKLKMFISIILIASISTSFIVNTTALNIILNPVTAELDNKQLLFNRAIEGINDAPNEVVNTIKENCVLKIDNVEQDVEPLVTTVLISSEELNSENTKSTYEATIISQMEIVNGVLSTTTYTKTEDVNSSGGEITLYTTIRFEVGDIGGVGYIKLKGVEVESQSHELGSRITYVKARYGYKGVNYNTRGWENYTSAWTQKTGKELSVTANCPTIEAIEGGILYEVWGEGLAHVVRGGSSWDTSHVVRENDMGWYM